MSNDQSKTSVAPGHDITTIYPSVFSKPEVRNELERLHEKFVLVPADKACNNIVFVCKAHLNELGINSTFGNPTYTQLLSQKMKFFIITGPF